MSRGAVAQWETQGGTDPSVSRLSRLAVLLDVPFEWLGTGRGQRYYPAGTREPGVPYSELAPEGTAAEIMTEVRRLSLPKQQALLILLRSDNGDTVTP